MGSGNCRVSRKGSCEQSNEPDADGPHEPKEFHGEIEDELDALLEEEPNEPHEKSSDHEKSNLFFPPPYLQCSADEQFPRFHMDRNEPGCGAPNNVRNCLPVEHCLHYTIS